MPDKMAKTLTEELECKMKELLDIEMKDEDGRMKSLEQIFDDMGDCLEEQRDKIKMDKR